ncbi:hypothetical protein [Mucilaginibacter pedocola]|uniref:Uncharacterized protein n=1 Tax=Mucilaginibacter pedocola TaxID=1792845 RepID=A0A1S9P8L0_9SPHI|nr:hypothetical protein [Mucilaginibacter pedocola]OOQ57167.1 hypothetical protein BC343_16740 [Mucilaginibacter pedocola]
MDFNIVTLEIADHLVHFNYYDQLITDANFADEQVKLRKKRDEHLTELFAGLNFYDKKSQLLSLTQLRALIIPKLADVKNKQIHELVEQLEKDTKKMKKLYKASVKK